MYIYIYCISLEKGGIKPINTCQISSWWCFELEVFCESTDTSFTGIPVLHVFECVYIFHISIDTEKTLAYILRVLWRANSKKNAGLVKPMKVMQCLFQENVSSFGRQRKKHPIFTQQFRFPLRRSNATRSKHFQNAAAFPPEGRQDPNSIHCGSWCSRKNTATSATSGHAVQWFCWMIKIVTIFWNETHPSWRMTSWKSNSLLYSMYISCDPVC